MSGSSDEEGEKLLSDGRAGKDLSSFLAKVDEIGDLVHGLVTSTDGDSSSQAIKKADAYLQRDQAESRANPRASVGAGGQDRTIINRGPPTSGTSDSTGAASAAAPTSDMGDFGRAIEEDAEERAQKRKEREKLGKEWKRKGTQAFRRQEFQAAVDNYSQAVKQCPWDISLYTNLALCHNKLGQFEEAIKACDTALKFEPATLRAYVHKGRALTSLKQYEKAAVCYQEAIKLFPDEREQLQDYVKELHTQLNNKPVLYY